MLLIRKCYMSTFKQCFLITMSYSLYTVKYCEDISCSSERQNDIISVENCPKDVVQYQLLHKVSSNCCLISGKV